MAPRVISRVAGLAALTAAGQLVIVGTLPLYSRIFDPATYGKYVLFVGAFTVVSVFAGVRYDTAIVLPRRDSIARALSWLVMLIAGLVATLIVLVTLLVSRLLLKPGHPMLLDADVGYGLAAATLIGALQRCLGSWCVRRGRFVLLGWGQFIFCLMTVIAQLLFVRVMGDLAALVWGFVCALCLQTACLSIRQLTDMTPAWERATGVRAIQLVARKYRRFPMYMVGYALASTARDRLVQLMLGLGAGAAAVGQFGLAYRVVFAPNSLIYSAVSPVFYGIASRESRVVVGGFAAALAEALFVVLVVPYVAFAIEAPRLTDALLSPKWRGTGPYLSSLVLPAVLLASTCWLDRAFDSFRRQRVAFALEASFTITAVALVGCLTHFVAPTSVIRAFAVLAFVYYWFYFFMTFIACNFDLEKFRHACITGLGILLIAVVFGLLAHRLEQPLWRFCAYALVMASGIALWIKFRNGAATLSMLVQSRVQQVAN